MSLKTPDSLTACLTVSTETAFSPVFMDGVFFLTCYECFKLIALSFFLRYALRPRKKRLAKEKVSHMIRDDSVSLAGIRSAYYFH